MQPLIFLRAKCPRSCPFPPQLNATPPSTSVHADALLTLTGTMCAYRFYSGVLQRSGKAHRKHGGGSLTLLAVVAGVPAAGQPQPRASAVAQYTTLTPAQKAKLMAALQQQQAAQAPALVPQDAGPMPGPSLLSTEVTLRIVNQD